MAGTLSDPRMAPGPRGAALRGGLRRATSSSSRRSCRWTGAARTGGGTAAEQARRALDNLAHQLRSTGLSLDAVAELDVYLVDQADLPPSTPPSRSASSPPYPAARSSV